MSSTNDFGRVLLRSGIASAIGLLIIPFVVVAAIALLVPSLPAAGRPEYLLLILLVGNSLGGAIWAYLLVRIAKLEFHIRLSVAGALGYGLAQIIALLSLERIEGSIAASGRLVDPGSHLLFLSVFAVSVFAVAALSGSALGIALKNAQLARRLALGGGFAASLAFIAVDLAMYLIGWRVGAPDFPERDTMTTVATLGAGAAALSGGAIIGLLLTRYAAQESRTAEARKSSAA